MGGGMTYHLSIATKLGLAAVLLVLALAGTYSWLGARLLSATHEEQARRLQAARNTELEVRSVAVASHVAGSAREALAGSEVGRLFRILRDIEKRDPEVQWAALADASKRILVRSDQSVDLSLSESLPLDELARRQSEVGPRARIVTQPIYLADGVSILGYLQLGWSLRQLDNDLAAIANQQQRAATVAQDNILLAGLLAFGIGLLVAAIAGVVFSRPIRRLATTADAIASGRLDARADIKSQDELGVLASTMNRMAVQLSTLLEETRRHAELGQELAVARSIQQSLLPPKELIECPGLVITGVVQAASQCGGDWWACVPLTRQRTLVLVGDVTGHGISSAMLTATARSCVDTLVRLTGGDFRVSELLRILDQQVRGVGDEYHMTCFASIYDPVEETLTYANAGHNQPLLLRHTPDDWRVGRLKSRGNRLGDADGYSFIEHTVATHPRDLLCWYSDGLIEALGPTDRPFGSRRLRAVLKASAGASPAQILANTLNSLQTHIEEQPLDDDVTCVIGRLSA